MSEENQAIIHRRSAVQEDFLRTITVVYMTARLRGDNFLLEKADERDKNYGYYSSGSVQTGPGYDVVTIRYQDLVGNLPVKRYLYRASSTQRPIELHSSWKPIWNYNVIGDATLSPDDASLLSFHNATKLSDVNSIEEAQFIRSNQAIPTSKTIVGQDSGGRTGDAEKKAQSYLYPSPEVTELVYTRDEATLDTYATLVGKRRAPGKTFGLSNATNLWLVTSAQAKRVNDWYEIVIVYRFFDSGDGTNGWDTDIYGT